jgi:hypothetical protein
MYALYRNTLTRPLVRRRRLVWLFGPREAIASQSSRLRIRPHDLALNDAAVRPGFQTKRNADDIKDDSGRAGAYG